jgi:hypothetical protein
MRRTPPKQRIVKLKTPANCQPPLPTAIKCAIAKCNELRRLRVRPRTVEAHELGGIRIVYRQDGVKREWACFNDGHCLDIS